MKLAWLIALVALFATPALAQQQDLKAPWRGIYTGGTVTLPPLQCPFGTTYVNDQGNKDGCTTTSIGSNSGFSADYNDVYWIGGMTNSAQCNSSTFANFVLQAGQVSTLNTTPHPETWNKAGCDYPLGYTTAYASVGAGTISGTSLTYPSAPTSVLGPMIGASVNVGGVYVGYITQINSSTSYTITNPNGVSSSGVLVNTSPLVDVFNAAAIGTHGSGWGQMRTGCSYTNSNTTVPFYQCTGAWAGEVAGLDFCQDDLYGTSNGTGGVIVAAEAIMPGGAGLTTGSTPLNIHDNNFCASSTSTNQGLDVANGIELDLGGNASLTGLRVVQHNKFDGGGKSTWTHCYNAQFYPSGGPCTSTHHLISDGSSSSGDRILAYDVFLNNLGRFITGTNFTPQHLYIYYSYGEGDIICVSPNTAVNGCYPSGDHGEWNFDGVNTNGAVTPYSLQLDDFEFNGSLQGTDVVNQGVTATFWINPNQASRGVYQKGVVENNSVYGNPTLTDTNCRVNFNGSVSAGTLTTTTTVTVPSGTVGISSGSYSSGTGLVTLTLNGNLVLAPGAPLVVSGATGSGTDLSLVNFGGPVNSVSGSTITYQVGTGKNITAISSANVSDYDCNGQGLMLVGAGVPYGTFFTSSGTGTSFSLSNNTFSVGTEAMHEQFVYNNSAVLVEMGVDLKNLIIEDNFVNPDGAGGCIGAPVPYFYYQDGTGGTGGVSSTTITGTSLSSATLPLQNTEVYTGTNGTSSVADTGSYVVSSSGSQSSWSVTVSPAVTITNGSTVGFGIENLLPSGGAPHVSFGSGATANINTKDNSTFAGFEGNSFGYTATCNGVFAP